MYKVTLFFQHSASVARIPAAAGPPGEEEPITTVHALREAEQLHQHDHLLGQQHTRECRFLLMASHLISRALAPKEKSWNVSRWFVRGESTAYLLYLNPW